ncbi:MAG: hypothetical protein ABL917_02470 [Parcubacteria group bacterium]
MSDNNQNNCQVCGSGNGRCGSCGNMCGFGSKHILRWILGIIIITWVFSIGMRFGELKAELQGSSYGNSYRHSRVMPMMGGASLDQNTVFFSESVPATQVGGGVKVIRTN